MIIFIRPDNRGRLYRPCRPCVTASEALLRNISGFHPPKLATVSEDGELGINFIDPFRDGFN